MIAVWLRAGLCAAVCLTAGCSLLDFHSDTTEQEESAAPEYVSPQPHVSPRARELFELARAGWDEHDQCRDPAAALGWLDAALRIQPEYGDALIWRGRALSESGYLEDAFDDLTHAIRIQPSALAYAERGLTGLRLGNAHGAERDLERALSLDQAEARAYVYRAALRFTRDEAARACSDLEEACARGLCFPREKAVSEGLCR